MAQVVTHGYTNGAKVSVCDAHRPPSFTAGGHSYSGVHEGRHEGDCDVCRRIEGAVDSWHVPPANQGQTVVVSYGIDTEGEAIYRRTFDRSDRSVSYERADLSALRGDFEPWNESPDVARGAWEDA
jgi:hypothetical protein